MQKIAVNKKANYNYIFWGQKQINMEFNYINDNLWQKKILI